MNARTAAAIITLGLAVAGAGQAQEEGLGVGIMVGEPTGLSLKKWVGGNRAIDAGVAWSTSENDSLHLHADYLVHNPDLLATPDKDGRFLLYCGIGARMKLEEDNNGRGRNNDDTLVGIRVPFGISYQFSKAPVDIFAEIVPVLDVVPDTEFDLSAAIGARFYFGK